MCLLKFAEEQNSYFVSVQARNATCDSCGHVTPDVVTLSGVLLPDHQPFEGRTGVYDALRLNQPLICPQCGLEKPYYLFSCGTDLAEVWLREALNG